MTDSKQIKKIKSKFYFPQTIVLLLVIFFIFLMMVSQTNTDYFFSVSKSLPNKLLSLEEISSTPTPQPLPGPIKVSNTQEPFLTARAAIVMDKVSRNILFAKNEGLPLWPASTTKIMTSLIALEEYDLNDVVTISNPVNEGRIMNLYEGEQISVNNLLHGLLIHSANDAAFALADYYSGGREEFISKMNKRASELKLVNTHFVNPAGFDDDKQYSTATDLALLSLIALDHPVIAQIVSIPSITLSDADYVTFHKLTNVNTLLGSIPGVAGGKTGWTENAKENLINITRRNGHEIITVILGSDDRFGETQILTDWIFTNYSWENITTE